MNEILIDQLSSLSKNTLMINAIKALFDEEIERSKPMIERTDNDKILGEKFRAYESSKSILIRVLNSIESYNIQNTKSAEINRAK